MINDRRHSLQLFFALLLLLLLLQRRHLIRCVWSRSNERAGQFAVLSVGVNSHAIRFQRLHYRGAPLVVGNIYVRFSH